MFTRRGCFAVFVLVALSATQGVNLPAQSASKSAPGSNANARADTAMLLRVAGDISQPLNLTSEEFAKLPRQTVRAKAHDGKESQFEGVSLVDVLAKAGVPTGKDLRGPAMSIYVVAEASDGYRATFALAELDSAFTDRVILLADRRDGKVLSAREGPLQMIVPGEKKHARWVRQVIRLKVGRG
jgi:DMSO/TMAO reductase YedYZ molybdopterin-dependent catalytic subunit